MGYASKGKSGEKPATKKIKEMTLSELAYNPDGTPKYPLAMKNVYRGFPEKYEARVQELKERYEKGDPEGKYYKNRGITSLEGFIDYKLGKDEEKGKDIENDITISRGTKGMTKDEIEEKPYLFDRDEYQRRLGVHQPWIAEISPMQMGMMSERQKNQYMKKRSAEWEASADVKRKWKQGVINAYDRGDVTLDSKNLSSEGREAIKAELERRKEENERDFMGEFNQKNKVRSMDDIKEGDIIFHPLHGYGKVVKKYKKSAKMEYYNTRSLDAIGTKDSYEGKAELKFMEKGLIERYSSNDEKEAYQKYKKEVGYKPSDAKPKPKPKPPEPEPRGRFVRQKFIKVEDGKAVVESKGGKQYALDIPEDFDLDRAQKLKKGNGVAWVSVNFKKGKATLANVMR